MQVVVILAGIPFSTSLQIPMDKGHFWSKTIQAAGPKVQLIEPQLTTWGLCNLYSKF